MAFIFPDIDPVILHLGNSPFKITWYSVSYIAGILLSWAYVKKLNRIGKLPPVDAKFIDDLITSVILGIIIGGRLGYVIFYDLARNLAEPINIIRTWEGGMSFHGGLLGVIIASFICCRIHKVKYFQIMDLLACATPIGLFFGRIANFVNAELYGRVTDSSWGIIFPGQESPRHASQLYEAATEGLLLFFILYFLFTKTKIQQYIGMISGMFLLFYALFRGIIENVREPDSHLGFIIYDYTMGQLLSLPMILVGVIIIIYSVYSKQHETN
jgi:phosphatidylglycerol---prolipoprotein diacylglyceryl transferase